MKHKTARRILYAAAFTALSAAAMVAQVTPRPAALDAAFDRALRSGDTAAVRAALKRGSDPNGKDAAGNPALMLATMFGDAGAVRALLDAGANPNQPNAAGATALMWAIPDRDKVRMLIHKGADVNARSAPGRTPLLIASAVDGGAGMVRMLLDKGANPNVKDNLKGIPLLFTGGGMASALMEAAKTKDTAALRLFLEMGLDVNAMDNNGNTALTEAALRGNLEAVKLLLAAGADVNHKTKLPTQTNALALAATRNSVPVARELIKSGADVNATDGSGSTPLMWAAYSEQGSASMLDLLLAAGASADVRNKAGETPMMWALRNGESPITARLRAAGAALTSASPVCATIRPAGQRMEAQAAQIQDAVERAIAPLQQSGPQFFKKSGCISCHHQSLPQMAIARARHRGFHVDEEAAQKSLKTVAGFLTPAGEILAEGTDVLPNIPVSGGYILMGLAAANYQPDFVTAAAVHNIAAKQLTDGSWYGWAMRAPLEAGDIRSTAVALRALQLYTPPGRRMEMQSRIQRAATWLRNARPHNTEEQVMQLIGLAWAGVPHRDLRRLAASVLDAQQDDGGWSQLDGRETDAYVTGEALVALAASGMVRPPDDAYQRGVAYLLRTQHADGTWHVRTRSFPFQPLVDSGFPHGRDQWISAAGTSWAAMALSLAAPSEPRTVISALR